MRNLFILIEIIFSLNHLAGQTLDLLNDLENGSLMIRQKPGTDRLLADYLAAANVAEDTVYAYIYIPSSCPRCESGIKLMKKLLNDKGKKFMLITVLDDKSAAEYYNKIKGYNADYYIYDTQSAYKRIFSFNNAVLDGSYILKITHSGRLITGTNDQETSPEIVRMYIAKTEPMEYKSFEDEDTDGNVNISKTRFSDVQRMKDEFTDLELNMPKDIQLCLTIRSPHLTDSLFYYPDEMLGGVPIFKLSANGIMRFERLLMPDSAEIMHSVKISKESYVRMKKQNMLFNIICNVNRLDNDNIGMSYSLPKLDYAENDKHRIRYFNDARILSRNINNYNVTTGTDIDALRGDYFYKHFQFSSSGDKVFISCEKLTWPMEYEPEDYKDNTSLNPFCDGFYDTNNPFMAAFDRHTGKLISCFAQLDTCARASRTGYYFVSPVSEVESGELAYSDGYSGTVYVADTTNFTHAKACYKAFEIDFENMPELDSTKFYTYEYVKPYQAKVFYRTVKDIRLTADNVYCLVKYNNRWNSSTDSDNYTFVEIDRKSGKAMEFAYPKHSDCKVFSRGLSVKGGRVYPFEVLKKSSKVWLRVYDK